MCVRISRIRERDEKERGSVRMTDLKPCPFCGGESELVIPNSWDPYQAYVRCKKCRISGPLVWMVDDENFKATAVKKWNTRKVVEE